MKVIGFNFSKISASKKENFKAGPINVNIDFPDMIKENLSMLKETKAIRMNFSFSLEYLDSEKKKDKMAELNFEGSIILSVSEEENKNFMKSWKKKILPPPVRVALSNLVIKRTAARAMQIQEDLNIPSHIPIQQLSLKK